MGKVKILIETTSHAVLFFFSKGSLHGAATEGSCHQPASLSGPLRKGWANTKFGYLITTCFSSTSFAFPTVHT